MVINKWVVAVAAMTAMSTAVAFEGNVRLGVGYGELENGGASDYAAQATVSIEGQLDSGFLGGLRYTTADLSGSNNEFNYTTAKGGYEFGLSKNVGLVVGALYEQIESSGVAGAPADDEVLGAWLGLNFAVAEGVEMGLVAAYMDELSQYDNVVDVSATVDIRLAADVTAGLLYWARRYGSDSVNDLDQDAISIMLGYHF